jgi:hypothetical protein
MKFKLFLLGISTIIISLFCLFPFFTSNNDFRIVVVSAIFYIIVFTFRQVRKRNAIPVNKIIGSLLFSFLLSFILKSNATDFFTHFSILVVFLFIYEYYKIIGIEKMKYVAVTILCFLLVSVLQTITMLTLNPAYARLLAKNQEDLEVVGLSGGYGLVYASLLSFFAIIGLIKKSEATSFIIRVALAVISILIIYLIWKAGFFLALVLLITGSLMTFLGVKKNNTFKSAVLFIFVLGSLSLFEGTIYNFAKKQTKNTKYEQKVESVFNSDDKESYIDAEFAERESRYIRDLELIVQYSIIGTWQFKLIGKHSFVLGMLAQFGLIFGSLFIYFTFLIPYKLIRSSFGLAHTQAFVFFGILFLFLLLNSLTIPIIPVVFVIFPYSNYIINKI